MTSLQRGSGASVAAAAVACLLGPMALAAPGSANPSPGPTGAAHATAEATSRGQAWIRVPGVDSDHDGRADRVHVRWRLPDDVAGRVPVVVEPSPYHAGLVFARNHDVDVDSLHVPRGRASSVYRSWVLPEGYAYVTADSLGSGGSTGCPSTGGENETAGMDAVVRWLSGDLLARDAHGSRVAATWSDGRIAIIGVSYNGTLANAAAASGVDGLDAVVAVSAISSWYDYYRSQGMVRAPGGYQGEDADVLAKAVLTRHRPGRCRDEIRRLRRREMRRTGDLTSFWRRRDYRRAASAVTAAVLTLHGTSDANVFSDQSGRWAEAVARAGAPVRSWWHTGGHGDALAGSGDPRWRRMVLDWLDHFLRDVDNGVLDSPASTLVTARGRRLTTPSWPAGESATLEAGPVRRHHGRLRLVPGSPDTGTLVDDARYTLSQLSRSAPRPKRLLWRSRELASPIELSGHGLVEVQLSVAARAANLSVGLVTLGHRRGTRLVSAGWADPQNHGSLAKGEALVPGRRYQVTVQMDQVLVRRIRAGLRLGLVVGSSDHAHTLRPPRGTRIHIHTAGTRLVLPVVGGQPALADALGGGR